MIDKNELVNLIQRLVQIESPYYHEDAIMEFCFQWLQDAGLFPQMHHYKEERAIGFHGKNIICKLRLGEPGPSGQEQRICLNGHLDTVPLCQGWTKPPYEGKLEDGRLYGLGALDMKAGCAALMLVMRALKEQADRRQGDADFCHMMNGEVILTLVSDEEGPYGLGTNSLIEEGLLDGIDCAVIPEPAAGFSSRYHFPVLCLGARGCFVYCVDFFGKPAHASQPENGINAAIEAAKFAAQCESVPLKSADPLGPGSLCVLKIEGDGGACSVPEFARVTIHRHITLGETEESVFEEARQLLNAAGVNCEYNIYVREYPTEGSKYYQPYAISEKDPYAVALTESIREATGQDAVIDYFSSIGDFNYLGTRLGKIPALIFGPDGKNMHSYDEYVDINSAYYTAEAIYGFLKKIFKEQQ